MVSLGVPAEAAARAAELSPTGLANAVAVDVDVSRLEESWIGQPRDFVTATALARAITSPDAAPKQGEPDVLARRTLLIIQAADALGHAVIRRPSEGGEA
ncbi:MAG TPA: hypothetical protein VLF71_04475 [Candidatus Saccharimonadales bacterium]|nr:hypothetical protein [Candidatus Saccharimonadales bacterium]